MFAIRRIAGCVVVSAMALGIVGCGSSSSSTSGSSGGGTSMDALAGQVDAQNAAKKQEEAANAAKAAADAAKAATERKATEAAAMAQQQKKVVGSREVVAGGGYYSAIIGARRHVMNVVDNISWIQGVRNFQGTYGRKPKDTKEFMNVCVKENDLQLPRIEADEEYLYDPNGETAGDFGQLYVVKKETAASAMAPSQSGAASPSK